jgi:hypothetical protein
MTIILSSAEIAQLRSDFANNPAALVALDMIEECEGDLEDAAISLAIRSGQEPDTSDRWLEGLAKRWRHVICQKGLKQELQTGLMAEVISILKVSTDLPSELVAPVAIFVLKTGVQEFCQPFEVSNLLN